MNILIANNFYAPDVVGGAELSVQGIAEGLAHRGHNVTILTTGQVDQDSTSNGVAICRRRFRGLMSYKEHLQARTSPKKVINKVLTIDNPRNARIIEQAMKAQKTDVVLSNNLLGITVELWRTAHRLGIPIMHTLRDYALMCPNSTLVCASHPHCAGRPKIVCEVMRKRLRKASELVNAASAPSQYTLEAHCKQGYFASATTRVIHNAVAFDARVVQRALEQRLADEEASRKRPLRIVYLGRLVEEKGVRMLLEALEMCHPQEVEAHFAGVGPLEDDIKRLHDGGTRVFLHGFLNKDKVHDLLMSCDVLVAPSVWPEPFGRIVLDAYIHAMPAVVSDAGGLPEVLVPGTGTVVEAGNASQLYQSLQSYIEDRSKLLKEGKIAAQSTQMYTIERQVEAFERELATVARA